MSTKLLDRETCLTLGSQMFALVSAKVLLLEKIDGCLQRFQDLLVKEELTDFDLLKDGFLADCTRHGVSRNEAERLFSSTKELLSDISKLN